MVSYINRNIYIDRIKPYIGKNIIKVFVGQRRVGKSYIMYQVMDELKKQNPKPNIIFIDKEKNEFESIKNHNDLLAYISSHKKSGKNAVFIDEIQDIEQFEKALRSIYSEPQYDIYCTGSNANMLSGELATYLSGRYIEIRIHPLSFNEFLKFHDLENNNESLLKYIRYGGLPNLIHLTLEDEIVFDYLMNIYAAILFKDIIKRYNIRNVSFLENLVKYLADNMASIVSGKKISDFLKSQKINITPNMVLDYLFYLRNAYFINKTQRMDVIGKKIFEIGDKYYFEDIGLRNSINGFKQTDINKLIENLVFSHLKINGYDVKVGTLDHREIDFVAGKQGEKIYIQTCYLLHDQKTIDREFGNLLAINDNYPKLVISMDEVFGKNTYQGIQHIHLRAFLTSPVQ